MDTASIVLLSLFGLFLLVKFFGYLSRLGIKQVTARELGQMKGITLLDTRTDKEYKEGHIPGSIHIPLSDVGSKAKKLRKDREIVVYCQSGNRSIWGIKRLMGMGAGIIFKGSGFYETDYKARSGSNGTGARSASDSSKDGESKPEAPKAEEPNTEAKKTEGRKTEAKKTEHLKSSLNHCKTKNLTTVPNNRTLC